MKLQIKIILLIIVIGILAFIGTKLYDKYYTEPDRKAQVIADEVDIAMDKVKFRRINRRGDREWLPTSGKATFKGDYAKGEEIDVVVKLKPNKIKADLGRYKGGLVIYPHHTEFIVLYEILHLGDFSLNVGATGLFPVIGIGWALDSHAELVIGGGVQGVVGGVLRI